MLTKLGLKEVEGILCLFANTNLIVFFYVNNIVVLVHLKNLAFYAKFKKQLIEIYNIQCLRDLQ